jgi:hypothetical protein
MKGATSLDFRRARPPAVTLIQFGVAALHISRANGIPKGTAFLRAFPVTVNSVKPKEPAAHG